MTGRRWTILIASMLGLGAILLLVAVPRATAATPALDEPEWPRTHQLVVCRPDEPCKTRGGPVGETACNLDASAERLLRDLPKATRVECRRVAP